VISFHIHNNFYKNIERNKRKINRSKNKSRKVNKNQNNVKERRKIKKILIMKYKKYRKKQNVRK
jgi:hypothetical protein